MRFQFFHKEFIWLFGAIVLFIVLFILLIKWKGKVIKRIGDRTLVKALINTYSSKLFTLKFGMLTIAFAAGVVMVMDLRKPGGPEGMNRKGIDVVVALDVSKSM
ncbi:MAG: VWA domain-containing protein, partial [Chitinophagaceae bacterium]